MDTNHKAIRFVDRDGVELFKIPDGATIRVTYPPGDGRGVITAPCKYEGEHHAKIGGTIYHIDEFAMRMAAIGAKYEPEVQLRRAEILPFTPGEEKYYTYNREKNNSCVGHIAGEFGSRGDRFFSSWSDRKNGKNTPKFQEDLHSAVYALRQSLLKNHDAMTTFCKSYPEAKLPGVGNLEHYGFKLEAGKRRYFVRCCLETSSWDSRFVIYAYNKAAPALKKELPEAKPSVLREIHEAQKAPSMPRREKTPEQRKNKNDTEL